MKNLCKIFLATFCFSLILAGGWVWAAEKEKPMLLKTASSVPLPIPGVAKSLGWMSDNIGEISGGTLKIKTYAPGKLVPPLQILDAVSKGAVGSGYTISGYWEGKIPGSSIFSSMPFGPEAPEYLAWMYHGNGRKLYQKMYDDAGYNVHVIPLGLLSPETAGWFTKPINKVEDIKGLNIRFYGLGGRVLQNLGASVSLIPGGEIFSALEKGVIDASEFSYPSVDSMMGFYKIAKYNYFPGWHQQATFFELIINKKVWNKMSPRQQNILEMMCKAATLNTLAYTESVQAKSMLKNKAEHDVKIAYLSDDILNALQASWKDVAADLSEKSPMFKEAYADISQFRQNYAIWGKYGFLPRNTQ